MTNIPPSSVPSMLRVTTAASVPMAANTPSTRRLRATSVRASASPCPTPIGGRGGHQLRSPIVQIARAAQTISSITTPAIHRLAILPPTHRHRRPSCSNSELDRASGPFAGDVSTGEDQDRGKPRDGGHEVRGDAADAGRAREQLR